MTTDHQSSACSNLVYGWRAARMLQPLVYSPIPPTCSSLTHLSLASEFGILVARRCDNLATAQVHHGHQRGQYSDQHLPQPSMKFPGDQNHEMSMMMSKSAAIGMFPSRANPHNTMSPPGRMILVFRRTCFPQAQDRAKNESWIFYPTFHYTVTDLDRMDFILALVIRLLIDTDRAFIRKLLSSYSTCQDCAESEAFLVHCIVHLSFNDSSIGAPSGPLDCTRVWLV